MKDSVHSASLHDFSAVHSLTTTLGQDIWKNSLIVLTFANIYEAQLCVVNPNVSEKDLLMKFDKRVQEWKEQFVEQLVHAGVKRGDATKIPVQAATSNIGIWQAALVIGVCLAAADLYALYKKQKRKKME